MVFRNKIKNPVHYLLLFFKWLFFGVLIGIVGGLIGTGFVYVLKFVTGLRTENDWLIFLLPLGGLAIVGTYRLFKLQSNRGTNEVIDSVLQNRQVNPLIAPAIFISTAITHFLGGSAGREGAALQLGGSVASLIGKLCHLKKEDRTILIMSGMSAVFAGVFGTPLTACLFTMEFEAIGTIFSPAFLPCFLSALVASKISSVLGVHAEINIQKEVFALDWQNGWKLIVLAVLVSFLGMLTCYVFHKSEHLAKKYIQNDWLRIIIGAVVIVVLTLLVGDQRYNGAGMEMAFDAMHGEVDWYSFLLKLLFTAVTLACGFKGGEIVPTFCIGATFGGLVGMLLGLDVGFAAALGLIGLFCSTTNSPLASIVLSVEMFGSVNLPLFALMCVITFVLSGRSGLYASQIFKFPKLSEVEKNTEQDGESNEE